MLRDCYLIGNKTSELGSPSRSILSRECMLLLTCLELGQMKNSNLIWSEQIAITFVKAIPELQRQLDGNRGIIFPGMYVSIARILSAIAAHVQVVTSEASLADAVTASWKFIVGKTDRPKFIVCIYEGNTSRKEYLIIATDHMIVSALRSLKSSTSEQNERIRIDAEDGIRTHQPVL